MSGILEQIMGKMDTLIEKLSANTQSSLDLLAAMKDGGAAPAAATEKPKATGRATTKKEEPASKTTEAELVAAFERIKGTDTEKRMPALKKIIADAGFASLKELRQVPAKFDETMAALTAYEASLSAAPADADDDL